MCQIPLNTKPSPPLKPQGVSRSSRRREKDRSRRSRSPKTTPEDSRHRDFRSPSQEVPLTPLARIRV